MAAAPNWPSRSAPAAAAPASPTARAPWWRRRTGPSTCSGTAAGSASTPATAPARPSARPRGPPQAGARAGTTPAGGGRARGPPRGGCPGGARPPRGPGDPPRAARPPPRPRPRGPPTGHPRPFLDSLAAGPDLAAPEVESRGAAGPQLTAGPTRFGQLFTGPGGDPYLLTPAGLTPLSRMAFELLRNDLRTQSAAYGGAAVTPAALSPADLAAHTAAARPAPAAAGLPAAPPELVTVPQGRGICAESTLTDQAPTTSVTLFDEEAVAGPPPAAQPGVDPACAGADSIAVRPGGGALVRALSSAGVGGTLYLVTDAGVKYPLASAAAAERLGYGAVVPSAAPEALLTLLPTGPSLDPAALTGGPAPARPAGPACAR
ncbi:type VII secretion protein EccB [Kitasatospora indigofera]|uniref:type VII secretion protein EccB n=1 Tax=Kitasatospora indigofera TaxID=67307 RepID=UPI0036579EFC